MEEDRLQQQEQAVTDTANIHRSALELGPRQRPTTQMLEEFEQSATCARLFFFEGTGADAHHDLFPGETATTNLEPLKFCNADAVNDDCDSNADTVDSALPLSTPKALNDLTIRDRLQSFSAAHSASVTISACASCGIKEIGVQFESIPLANIACLFTEGECGRVEVWRRERTPTLSPESTDSLYHPRQR